MKKRNLKEKRAAENGAAEENIKTGGSGPEASLTVGAPLTVEASLTVEAAVVMSIVLLSLMSLILLDFRVHDEAAAENALLCSVEMYSHRNKYASWAENCRIIAEDTDIYIAGGSPVELKPGLSEGQVTGTVRCGEEEQSMKNPHLRAEQLLRAATLAGRTEESGRKGTTDMEGAADTDREKGREETN